MSGVVLVMMFSMILWVASAEASIPGGRRCTHPSGVWFDAGGHNGGAVPAPGTVISWARWWYGEVLLGERVVRYLEPSPPPSLVEVWTPGEAGPIPRGFGEVTSRQEVVLSRADGQPLHPDLGASLTLTMACTDLYTPPRP